MIKSSHWMFVKPKKVILYLSAISFLIYFSSCSSYKKHNEKESITTISTMDSTMSHFAHVFGDNSDKIFRSVDFNMSKNHVKNIESETQGATLIGDDKNMLFYELELTSDTSKSIDYAEIKYFFDVNDALDIISVNYYILDSLTINNLSETIFRKMTAKYGPSYVDSDDYIVWESSYDHDGKSTLFEVATKKMTKINDPGVTVEYLKY